MSSLELRGENLHLWRGDRHVLRGVDLHVGAGEVLQVVGANGSGKTSLLRTLCALLQPEEGRVLWGGRNVSNDLPSFHSQLAYLGHEPPLKIDLTAGENLRYWIGLRRKLSSQDLTTALERTDAGALRDRPIRTLSAGQKRRVALAGLVLLAAPLWLLDEPTTNLDTAGQMLVGQLIAEHSSGGGLVVAAVHHELGVAPGLLRQLALGAA